MERDLSITTSEKDSNDELSKLLGAPKLHSPSTRYSALNQWFTQAPLTTKTFVLLLFSLALISVYPTKPSRRSIHRCGRPGPQSYRLSEQRVNWRSCGESIEGYDCANITVPLDYETWNDEPYPHHSRTMTIAVTRFKATDTENRQGAIFLNPGGPGGSGTAHVYRRSKSLSTITKGQFDLIGFDPRGINMTRPYVSCFSNELEAEVFRHSVNDFKLELPNNISTFPGAHDDLERQIKYQLAATKSLAHKCHEKTGDAIAYMGTQAVVHDIDFLSKLIEGQDKPVNFWGFSYGTVIGQYLIKILPPHRIGRVIIDGVVNPTIWSSYPTIAHAEGLDNVDDVLRSFASSCYDAKENCTLNDLKPNSVLNFTGPNALLSAIDDTLDSLYSSPVPVYDLDVPAVATSSSLRSLMFRAMYSIDSWPSLADHLANVFQGNYTGIVNATIVKVIPEDVEKPDSSTLANNVITCSDTKPYDDEVAQPTLSELADIVFEDMRTYSMRMGNQFFLASICHAWDADGLLPRKSRYSGTFDMEDDVLRTPMLVLSNTYDPVTSLASAKYANDRLGNNARLIQQKDGWGHCSLSQISYCTARAVRKYMVDGEAPTEKHTMCDVDQLPWRRFDNEMWGQDIEETELKKAWTDLADDWMQHSAPL